MSKEQFINEMFEKGILVNKELLEKMPEPAVLDKIKVEQDLLVLNDDYCHVLEQQKTLVDWYDIDRYRVAAEKERNEELYQRELNSLRHTTLTIQNTPQQISSLESQLADEDTLQVGTYRQNLSPEILPALPDSPVTVGSIQIVFTHQATPRKYEVKDFTTIFTSRYRYLEKVLRHRQELQNALPIGRLPKERQNISIIGVIDDIGKTKNDNLMAKIEDITGKISVIFSKSKKELFQAAQDLIFDEVVGISGVCQDNIIFAENIVWPDLPDNAELKKSPEEEYAIFLSDFHVGSKLFLHEEFNRFLDWINGRAGNEQQQDVAKKVKYIIIPGDLIDGIGIYPSQEEELAITDIRGQYETFANLIKQIPVEKKIIICPGNHDVVHIAEPQTVFYKEYASVLHDLPNVTLVSNPAMVTIGKTDTFSGFDVLLYHGYSFDYYVANVESIRNGGGYKRADLIMKFLLKRRHLAPSFKSTPYFPGYGEDPLIIKKIPDFFITGHIHYCSVANYKGVTMISGSCWQDKTSFQEKLGHEPEPARVPLVNLHTRQIKILRFM